MYITKDPETAGIVQSAGVDRVFVDLEYIGKAERQGGMDTVLNHHTPEDVRIVREALEEKSLSAPAGGLRSAVLARINPLHGATSACTSSEEEIDEVIDAGADIVMLPYFKTTEEVRTFLELVDGRVKTSLLVETPEAVSVLDDILGLQGIDEIHIGLNDLSIGYGRKFMFELLADGTIERICGKIKKSGIPYGFGGIARPGSGILPAERIIREHYRLGSTGVILSRSFCNTETVTEYSAIAGIFSEGVAEIRELEAECIRNLESYSIGGNEEDRAGSDTDDRRIPYFELNRLSVIECVRAVCGAS